MRFVMYGAGAIGGVVGAQLHRHGHEVVFIARGAHYRAIRESGLRFASPEVTVTLPVDVVDAPDQIDFRADDVVVLAMKSQDTEGALDRVGRGRSVVDRGGLHAERRRQRAGCAPVLRVGVRGVRGVPRAAPRAGIGGGLRAGHHRDVRHRAVPERCGRDRGRRSRRHSTRRPASRSPAPTSCDGSTASSSTT